MNTLHEGHKWEAEAGVSAWATKEEPISKREERKKQSPGRQLRSCESLQCVPSPSLCRSRTFLTGEFNKSASLLRRGQEAMVGARPGRLFQSQI